MCQRDHLTKEKKTAKDHKWVFKTVRKSSTPRQCLYKFVACNVYSNYGLTTNWPQKVFNCSVYFIIDPNKVFQSLYLLLGSKFDKWPFSLKDPKYRFSNSLDFFLTVWIKWSINNTWKWLEIKNIKKMGQKYTIFK